MRIRVERVFDARTQRLLCSTPLGSLVVAWEGRPMPTAGEHDVELDVPAILEWGHQIWHAGDGRAADDPERTVLAGTLIGFDELGVAEIELREGVIVVETLGDPPLGVVGEAVELRPPTIHAYPYDL